MPNINPTDLTNRLKKAAIRKGGAVFAVSREERLRVSPVRTVLTAGLRRIYYGLLNIGAIPEVFKVKTFYGEPIYGHARPIFPVIIDGFYGGSDLLLTNFFIEKLHEGDVVIDGGAHSGWYAMLASFLVGSTGQVHAFEPTPRIFETLELNARLRQNVIPNPTALYKSSGTISFFDHGRLHDVCNQIPSQEELSRVSEAQRENPDMKVLTVPAVSIDEYCKTHNIIPKLIKLDLEGGEPDALEGAVQTLSHHPIVITEVLGKNRCDGRTNEMLEKMKRLGYRPFLLNESWQLSPYSSETPIDLADVVFMV